MANFATKADVEWDEIYTPECSDRPDFNEVHRAKVPRKFVVATTYGGSLEVGSHCIVSHKAPHHKTRDFPGVIQSINDDGTFGIWFVHDYPTVVISYGLNQVMVTQKFEALLNHLKPKTFQEAICILMYFEFKNFTNKSKINIRCVDALYAQFQNSKK